MIYKILARYIKELNFEIPNPNTFFLLSKEISNYKINIDIKSNQVKERITEVQITLNLNPVKIDQSEKINTKIIYSAIVEMKGDISNKIKLKEIILVKVPTDIYQKKKKSFVFLFEQSGFKDIKIDKNIDFKKLYEQKLN